MLDRIVRERYRAATVNALDASFKILSDHEKLLLLYYHVDGMKLREIARLVEQPSSPLRQWFQRQSKLRVETPSSRVHESTVMRWLEKVYSKILNQFRHNLGTVAGLKDAEVDLCVGLGVEDLAPEDIRRHLREIAPESIGKGGGD
jgi:hypothetical protein